MKTENIVIHELSRMAVFRLLSDCFFLPDPGLSEKLQNLEFNMTNVCETAVPFIQNMRKEFKAGANLEPLEVDFAKLFVGPYKLAAAPYGSVYLEGERKMMGNSTIDAKNRYQEAGLDTAINFKDAPDHIAVELEFMHFLIFKEMEAIDLGDDNIIITYLLYQQSFLNDHLGAWVSEFTDKVTNNARTSFYQNLARATEAFVKDNAHQISSALASRHSN